jgi:uncharacterized membrane protein YraQ (UPF0718 family)
MSVVQPGARRPSLTVDRRAAVLGAAATAVLFVAALAWAKWVPYLHRLHVTDATGAYPGKDVLAKAGAPGDGPSAAGAWAFTKAYIIAIWPALVAGLLIAAAIEALLPRRWMLAALGRGGAQGRVAGGVAAMPSMMCTCCAAPVARTLRRVGVPTETALAYWLGNPVLNPAVIAFLALVAPWQWVATRVLVGALLVFAVTGVVARWAERHGDAPETVAPEAIDAVPEDPRPAPLRFARALAKLSVVLIPEYLVVVFAVGLLRGWLLPIGDATTQAAVLVTLLAAVAGTLAVIPTAGEIPLLTGLAAVGLGAGPIGALLLTLPAISLPSMAMVGRTLTWRATLAMAVAVAGCGVLAGALLWVLGG